MEAPSGETGWIVAGSTIVGFLSKQVIDYFKARNERDKVLTDNQAKLAESKAATERQEFEAMQTVIQTWQQLYEVTHKSEQAYKATVERLTEELSKVREELAGVKAELTHLKNDLKLPQPLRTD